MVKLSNNFTKNLARKEILVPHLNTWFANAEFPDAIPFNVNPNKEKDDAFHPSSAERCSLELFAARRGDLPEEKHGSDAQKNFMIGHMYHGLMQWIVVEGLGFSTWDEVEKEYDLHFTTDAGNPYRIRGFIDIARCEVPNKGTYLVDIKTMNSRIYAQGLSETTMKKYRSQIQLYLAFEGLETAILLAVEKDSPHQFKEILIEADPAFVDRAIARWEDVVDSLVEGRVPDCTCLNPERCVAKGIYPYEFVT